MPDAPERKSLIVAWAVPDGARCVVAERNGQWEVLIEQEGVEVARSVFPTATEALADAERRHFAFLGEHPPKK